jgi:hypothetical protein
MSIAFYGDSISVGAWAGSTNDSWNANGFVGLLRTALQSKYGNGGQGFLDLGRYEWVKTGTWSALAGYGPFGFSFYASNDPTSYWTLTVADGDNLDIVYARGSGYGSFDVVVDGGSPITVTPTGSADASTQTANVSLGSSGAHTVVIKAPASGTLYLIGASIYKGSNGLVVHDIARSGSAVNDMANQINTKLGVLPFLTPRLNMIGYVANDFGTQTALSSYNTRLTTLATKLKTYGDVMLWMPPDSGVTGKAIPVTSYEQVVRDVSSSNGLFWYDVHRAWGSYAQAVALGYMFDTTHPNTAGHAAMETLFMSVFSQLGA